MTPPLTSRNKIIRRDKMQEIRNSKDYSWKLVEQAEVLSQVACDFLYAKLTSDTDVGDVTLYAGEDTNAERICKIAAAGLYNNECNPPVGLYCPKGLYVGTITTGEVLVVWRVRDSKEG